MSEPNTIILKNAVFVPRGLISPHNLIYDEEFQLVESSCILRGPTKSAEFSNAPSALPGPIGAAAEYSDSSGLFLGHFIEPHYGHLLTEGVARYWYLFEHGIDGKKILEKMNPFGAQQTLRQILRPHGEHWKTLLGATGVTARDFLVSKKPVRLAEITIPEASWYERHSIHPIHLQVTRRLASKISEGISVESNTSPVYLSRTGLKKSNWTYLHEEEIEKYCMENGCAVVHPERLSLIEQIELFNKHDVFVGCEGSAFHSVLLRYVDRPLTLIYLARQGPVPNFELIDEAMGNKVHYIRCYYRKEGEKELQCDPEEAISVLGPLIG